MRIYNYRFKTIILVFLLFLYHMPAAMLIAQSTKKVYGTVIDRISKEPLYGANIIIEGTGYGAATDSRGYYEMENLLEGVYTITAHHIGYEKQRFEDVRLPKDQPVLLNFSLKPKTIPLRGVEVYADRYIEQQNTDIWVIKNEAISKSNVHNIGELIDKVPGVEVRDEGGAGGSKKISIRGSNSNQVLVLLDGVPLNDELSGDVDLSNIPVNIIERIEVHKGGSSNQFGSGAIGGAVNIITKKVFQNDIQLNSGFGAFQSYTVTPTYSGHFRNVGYMAAYQYLSSKGNYPYQYTNSDRETIHEDRMNADITSHNYFARINYTFKEHQISIHGQQMLSKRGIPGKIDAWTPYARIDYFQNIFGVDYHTYNPVFNMELGLRYSDSKTENRNLYPANVDRRYRRYPQYHYQYSLQNLIIKSKIDYIPTQWFKLSLGYTYRGLTFKDENFRVSLTPPIENAEDISHGVFIHQDWRFKLPVLSTQLSITPTIRYDEMDIQSSEQTRFERQWSPACGMFLSFGNIQKIYIKSSVSKSFRVPTFADLFYQDVRVKGKPDLLPEKSDNIEAGIGWNLVKWIKLHGEVTHFNYTIKDLIVWRLGSFEVFRPFNNDAEISGQEYLLTAHTLEDMLRLQLSYTHLSPLNKNKFETTFDKIIIYRPQRSFKGSAEIYLDFAELTLGYKYIGKRYVKEANTQSIPEYFLWDVNLNIMTSFKKLAVILKFSVYNITDEKYTIVRDMPLPGREWRIGCNLAY